MRIFCLFFLLISAGAQTSPGTPDSQLPADAGHNGGGATSSVVAGDAAVLTIKGLCPDASATKDPKTSDSVCQTIVTRSQFENLVAAIQPKADAATKRQIAHAYPQLLIMAREAQQRGLDRLPQFEERLAFARLQILSQALTRQIQTQAADIPEKDILAWYQTHADDFEEANLERIIVPNTRQQTKAALDERSAGGGKGDDEALIQEANALRARAAAGEDFAKLQSEAYQFAGMAGNDQPNPKLTEMHRRGLPPAHAAVFNLKPGEVSPVISDNTGRYVYKVDSKEMESLQAARSGIISTLRRQRVKEMMESVQKPFATDVNTTYFGADTSVPSD
jgi:hypothetical protein